MIQNETEFRGQAILEAARHIATAARTAPKGRGEDLLEILVLDGPEKDALAARMNETGERLDLPGFRRDSKNVLAAGAVVLIGTSTKPRNLKYCGLCGYKDCAALAAGPGGACVVAVSDLGIAVGSAVALAADLRIDNRIMYTAGLAAVEGGLFTADVKISYGIPLSVSGKNPFFDRA